VIRTEMIRLADDRLIACDVSGELHGHPLIYFHGAPSARIEPELFSLPELASELGICLISPDRPGLGCSDYQRNRTISDWPDDVSQIADFFGFQTFSVIGYSGGGPYALACAQQIPGRLESVLLVSSTGPHEFPELTEGINENSYKFMRLSIERPIASRFMIRGMAIMAKRFPSKIAEQAIASLPSPDAAFMQEPGKAEVFARLVAEAGRRNGRGPQHDTALMVRPWGIDLDAITMPVRLWHGSQDCNAPIAMGQHLAAALSGSSLRECPHEGHLSLFGTRTLEILAEVTSPSLR
jgi:pimeloyl-ACP methyl ester carboxylesterase